MKRVVPRGNRRTACASLYSSSSDAGDAHSQEDPMSCRRYVRACFYAAVLAAAAGCGRTETLTPEEARARGDAMLRQMSQSLAAAQAFSYRVEQEVEHVRGGARTTERFSRRTIVRRPNQLAFTDSGQDHDAAAWYDGK